MTRAIGTFAPAALSVLLAAAQGPQTGAVAGRVTDTSGGVLPGVTITVTGLGVDRKGVTDRAGDYRFDGLPSGTYHLQAQLAGFRRAVVDPVAVDEARVTVQNLTLRLGIITTHGLYVMPRDGLSGALREASVVVVLRITSPVGSRLLGGSMLAMEHEASVTGIVKVDAAGMVAGSSIRFSQLAAGTWFEDGRSYGGSQAPFQTGQVLVAFLRRGSDGTLTELIGPHYMFPVSDKGRVTFLGQAGDMSVEECLAVLRKMLGGALP